MSKKKLEKDLELEEKELDEEELDEKELEEDEELEEETDEEKDEEKEEEEDEEAIKTDLKSFIKSETIESLDKELEAKADELVKKFFSGVKGQRAKAIRSNKTHSYSDDQLVRKWFSCLINHDTAGMRQLQKDYLRTDDAAQGGRLVPTALLNEVNRFVEEYGVARRDMRYLPFSGPGKERNIPTLTQSVSVFWVGQAGAKPSTKPNFGLVTQTLAKIAAIVPMTEEILEDSAIPIIPLLGELFGEAVAMEEDRVFLNGNTGDGDPFMGIIRAAGIVPVTGPATVGAIDADDLNNMIYAVPREIRNKGKFYLHSTIFSILQQLKATDGHYIVQTPTGTQPGTIWNRPYELVDVLPDNTATGQHTPIMFYTDLSKTCVYGDKAGLQVKMLDQAIVQSAEASPSDLNLATQDMVAMRIVKRVGYVPVLPAGVSVLRLGV